MGKLFGLIGYPLSHSFSKKYFTEKFHRQGLSEHHYQLFEISTVAEIKNVITNNPALNGLNVTIPYKETVIPFMDKLDASAGKVGAVNVIKIEDKVLTGYNSDYYGFEKSLIKWLPDDFQNLEALILGTGGASKAVKAVLKANNIAYKMVSRNKSITGLTYTDLAKTSLVANSQLIINTTPLGMSPNTEVYPNIPYNQLSRDHYVYDLIYNPKQTLFLQKASDKGAAAKNGLEMLELQAEKSWDIWTS